MRRYIFLSILTLAFIQTNAQTPAHTQAAAHTQPPANTPGYRIKYDHKALRIPGNKFAIGMIIPAEGKTAAHTIGYSGKGSFGKYHVEVDSGSFSGGNVKLHDSKGYKKGDSVTVNIYKRKWFLGGRGAFLTSRKIPYSYENEVQLLTNSNIGRFPGGHIKFGVRTVYNNGQSSDLWYPVKKRDKDKFLLTFDGGHLSKSKGDWKIDPDPTHIDADQVSLFAGLAKNPAIADTLRLLLDYKAAYTLSIRSNGTGHDLNVNVDAFTDETIHATLLSVEVHDTITRRVYRYLINTESGSMKISTSAGDGANGDNGQSGYDGRSGADGAITKVPIRTTDDKGNVTITYEQTQGPGGNGEDGSAGSDGENGYSGFDGGNITVYYTRIASQFLKMITTTSTPGDGGHGGSGGAGGNGGSGGNGNPPGRSGNAGPSGNSGSDGPQGRPGQVQYIPL